jgi:hypothetical protein
LNTKITVKSKNKREKKRRCVIHHMVFCMMLLPVGHAERRDGKQLMGGHTQVAGSPIERSERVIAKLIFLLHQGVR